MLGWKYKNIKFLQIRNFKMARMLSHSNLFGLYVVSFLFMFHSFWRRQNQWIKFYWRYEKTDIISFLKKKTTFPPKVNVIGHKFASFYGCVITLLLIILVEKFAEKRIRIVKVLKTDHWIVIRKVWVEFCK